MKKLLVFFFLCSGSNLFGQPLRFSVANAHSHNDYEQKMPFWLAYNTNFGSMEADIFLENDELLVAHDRKELANHRTLEDLYLNNLQRCLEKNANHAFPDTSRKLQVLIDIKTDSVATLNKLVEVLKKYPALISNTSLSFVISGSRPAPSTWVNYPSFIHFDGILSETYSEQALTKIVLLSDDFKTYSLWDGNGDVPKKDWSILQSAVDRAHSLKKPVRFWNAPDFSNAWEEFVHLGVDYINTDHIAEIATFFKDLSKASYTNHTANDDVYQPTYKTDDLNKPVKNIILLIGDGTGLAQLYAGYTANKSKLSVFNMRQVGLSKTSSFDSYITDSAPGATSMSSGVKTNNRSVGVDHLGKPVLLLPEILNKKKKKTGLVTCGDIADATPADFYAHQVDRDSTIGVLRDLAKSPIDILMGSGNESLINSNTLKNTSRLLINDDIMRELQSKYVITYSIDSIKSNAEKKCIVIEQGAGLSMLNGRGDWLKRALSKTIDILSQNKQGFFIMAEGAQVDYGGHANDLSYVATEVIDFDQAVGKALEFADRDGETLVIVTADHETGGLSLVGGDYSKRYVSGRFSTNEHTAIPVPVFAYGPRSGLFRGVYENTAIFSKILAAFGH